MTCFNSIQDAQNQALQLLDIHRRMTDDEMTGLLSAVDFIREETHQRTDVWSRPVPDILVPDEIRESLQEGADLVISISGGKDSQALLKRLVRYHRTENLQGRLLAIHADLGRAEWDVTMETVRRQCEMYGVELVVVQREKGDLFDRMEDRLDKLQGTGKPFWPSAASRYCTSDLKRDVIDKYLRTLSDRVVCAMGLRREESTARAKKLPCQIRRKIQTQSRDALDWNPLLDWTEEDVWMEIGHTMEDLDRRRRLYDAGFESASLEGWMGHPAYVYGNERLSCVFCVLGSRNDLLNGARHHPEKLQYLIGLQERSGFTFRKDLDLTDLVIQ